MKDPRIWFLALLVAFLMVIILIFTPLLWKSFSCQRVLAEKGLVGIESSGCVGITEEGTIVIIDKGR